MLAWSALDDAPEIGLQDRLDDAAVVVDLGALDDVQPAGPD
jgi:hypothetical protein